VRAASGLLVLKLVVGLTATLLTATPPVSAGCDDTWRAIDTDGARSGHWLNGIAVRSERKVWVAGTRPGRGGRTRTLIKRWDGSRWTREESPNVRGASNYLSGAAVGAKGAPWAVGNYSSTSLRTIALRRGRARWWRTASVDPNPSLSSLWDVTALSNRRVWAVGTRWGSGGDHFTMIQRWNGKRWRVVGPANLGGLLEDVSARRWNDVWAVGVTVRNNVGRTLTLRFNGKRWRQIKSPNASARYHRLNAVEAVARNEAWAGGYRHAGQDQRPVLMRWNGTRWRLVVPPPIERGTGTITGIAAHGDEVIVIGEHRFRPLILVKSGSTWSKVDTSAFREAHLVDIEHAPSGAAFIAGYRSTRGGSEVVLRRDPPCAA
jgi:hypothetical protein